MRKRVLDQAVTKVTCLSDAPARRALFVLGAALMNGRHWQSAVQTVPTNRVIEEQEHLPQPWKGCHEHKGKAIVKQWR